MSIGKNNRLLRRLGVMAAAAALVLAAGAPPRPDAWIGVAVADAAEETAKVIELKIEKGKLAGGQDRFRVTQGDAVRLRWSTDKPITLHLHGYDIEKKVLPGEVAEFSFKAHATGRFPVNVHGASHGAHHEQALMYLEVYPR